MFDVTTIYRRTTRGAEEIQTRAHGLEQRYRRALIMIDGVRDVTELSVMMRPGEVENAISRLIEGNFIEATPAREIPADRVVYVAIANDPTYFATLKASIVIECQGRLGAFAETVIAEIMSCETALEMRVKLRDIEQFLIAALGEKAGMDFAHSIGEELIRLVPRAQ
jgi:hypothetical protein